MNSNDLKLFQQKRATPIDIIKTNIYNKTNMYNKINITNNLMTNQSNMIENEFNELNESSELNYSIYIDNSEAGTSPDNLINKVYPKQNDKWVDSNLIYICQLCSIGFTFFNRKHHCRACGGVFCGNCCNKYIEIPENLIKIPEKDTSIKFNIVKNTFNWFSNNNTQLVCDTCEKKIDNLKKVDYLIKVFEYLDLESLYKIKPVCKNYNIASTLLLSKFRDIQYGIYNKSYTLWERYILYESKEYLINHTTWCVNLIKSIIEYTYYTKNNDRVIWLENTLKMILENNSYKIKNISCFTLMCSRKCKNKIDFDDIIEILEYIRYIIKKDKDILNINEIKNIIIICTQMLFSKILNKINTVIPIICNFYNNLFEYDIIYSDIKFINKLFDVIFTNEKSIKKIISLITYEKYYYENNENIIYNNKFFRCITKYINDHFGTKLLNDITKMMISINNILNDKTSPIDFPFIYPFDPNYIIVNINNKYVFKSNTHPLLVNATIKKIDDGTTKNVKFIIKRTNVLRKEQLISCLVDILQYKISDTYIEIPTYQIIMLTKEIGVIEYIENSITLRNINEKGYTLQNFILNKNLNNKLDTIKTQFVKSLAISSAIAYIIGLGDRHLDNIMINSSGSIFHVDYGYIMENPTIIFNMPEIKVTDDIIDFLGGNNSKYYNDFKELIVKIYNQYRANKNILYIYFKFICDNGFLDWNKVYNKLDSKLMTGMKCKDVEITLINEIESSNTYTGFISDICHNYKQKLFN